MTTVWLLAPMPESAAERFKREFPDVEFLQDKELPDDKLAAVDAMFVTDMPADDVIEKMTNLRWLHGTHGGVGAMLTPPVVARDLTTTSSRGTHAVPFSEFTIACIFALAKHFPSVAKGQAEHRMMYAELPPTMQVRGKTLGIVGFGAIGSETARLASLLGMRVIATKRTVEDKPDYVDWIKTPDALDELLSESDVVVLSVPGTPETKGMINEQTLAKMKPTAYLINLTARNAIPDEELIARALREGRLGGAAFQVFAGGEGGSPVKDTPLWDAPNFIVGHRIPTLDPHRWERSGDLFCENLRRFITGEEMLNLGKAAVGY